MHYRVDQLTLRLGRIIRGTQLLLRDGRHTVDAQMLLHARPCRPRGGRQGFLEQLHIRKVSPRTIELVNTRA